MRNADVVWLENWVPSVYIGPVPRVEMTFDHAEELDIRARARTLQHLIRWEDEGAVVERWIKNSLSAKDGREPSHLALGRYLKEHWSRKLERQDGLKHSKPSFIASNWQPLGLACSTGTCSVATRDPSALLWCSFCRPKISWRKMLS